MDTVASFAADLRLGQLKGVIALVLTFLCWGVAGPAFKLVHVHPLVRLSWRGQASLIFIAPFAINELVKLGPERRQELLTRRKLAGFLMVGTSMFGIFVTWNYAISGPVG